MKKNKLYKVGENIKANIFATAGQMQMANHSYGSTQFNPLPGGRALTTNLGKSTLTGNSTSIPKTNIHVDTRALSSGNASNYDQYLQAAGAAAMASGVADKALDYFDPLWHVAGSRHSGVGDGMGNMGKGVFQAGLTSWNPWVMAAGAGLKVGGDLVNLGWGYGIENEQAVKNNIGRLQGIKFKANDNDTLASQYGKTNLGTVSLGKVSNGMFNHKGTKIADDLAYNQNTAADFAFRDYKNQGLNINKNTVEDDARTSYALGGDLSATNYGLAQDFLTIQLEKARNKNKMDGMNSLAFANGFGGGGCLCRPYCKGGTLFALGGDVQMNGADYSTGLTHVDAGSSHELNPNEGVQMGVDEEGVPNLVEEGEVIFNDYVYSNRIELDDEAKERFHFSKKRDITYADAAKSLEKEIAERPNDPISKAGFKAQMEDLAEEQERQKQEMEAERAEEAFDALSDEEKIGVMQYAQQQEQTAQEQAMAEEALAAEQQGTVSPEEVAMMQQQEMAPTADAMGTVAAPQEIIAQQPMMACGGKINKFDKGGDLKQKIYDLLGLKSKSDWDAWVKKNGFNGLSNFEDWENALQNKDIINAIAKDNPALRHALENHYDFGLYKPDASGNITFDDDRGNWYAQTVQGWWNSTDPAWREVIRNNPKLTKDTKLSREELADLIRNTEAFKKGTKWLQDSEDNRLNYLRRIINNPGAPKGAVAYARNFIDENGWKQGAARDYDTIFNNPSGRAANPGTYWKTPIEVARESLTNNYIINKDGTVEPLEGSTDGLILNNTYQWAGPQSDYINNYYKRLNIPQVPFRTVGMSRIGQTDPLRVTEAVDEFGRKNVISTPVPTEDVLLNAGDTAGIANGSNGNTGNNAVGAGDGLEPVPVYRDENLRYAGLLGPAFGLGMQMLGIGRPNTGSLQAVAENFARNTPELATYKPIGNYMRYRPLDIWAEQKALDAQARATDRAIANTTNPAKMAGQIANSYASQLASGEAVRKGTESNINQNMQVENFNKGTDMFNAEAFTRNSQYNADVMNRNRQYASQLAMNAAQAKMGADAGWYQGIYGNVGNIFKGISDLGRENAQHNMIAEMAANGLFGPMSPSTWVGQRGKYLTWKPKKNCKGGKINKRRG